MLKLEYFKYIIKVAEVQSISRAAEELYISQPHLSIEIKHLEEELGVTLFTRTNRGIQLTPAGERFLWYAYRICKDVDRACAVFQIGDEPKQEALSVASIYSFTMLDIFQSFYEKNQDKRVSLHYDEIPNRYIPQKVAAGHSNIGIVYLLSTTEEATLRRFDSLHLKFTPLFFEPLYAVVGSKHPLAQNTSVTLKTITTFPIVVEKIKDLTKLDNSDDNLLFPDLFKRATRMPLTFDNNRSLMYYLTCSEHCFSVGQRGLNLTNPFVKSGELHYIPIADAGVTLTTGYITSTQEKRGSLVTEFIDHLTSSLSA